jgi:hypothetical protein
VKGGIGAHDPADVVADDGGAFGEREVDDARARSLGHRGDDAGGEPQRVGAARRAERGLPGAEQIGPCDGVVERVGLSHGRLS